MAALPYRQLGGFYFFYFAYIGAFAPFFSVYLVAVGLSPIEIGIVMALPQVTRIVAPHLWGWLADAAGHPIRLVRFTAWTGTLCWIAMFASGTFGAICAVILAVGFFLSAALPLVEATTLTLLGAQTDRYGAVRLWGSIGYIAAVVGAGYALDVLPVVVLLWIVAATLIGTAAFTCFIPDSGRTRDAAQEPIWSVLKRPEVLALILACTLMAVAHGPYYTFFSVHLVDHGYAKGLIGWLWALGVACEIAIFAWLPKLYAAWRLHRILAASFALTVVRFLLIGWGAESLVLLLIAQALHAASFGSFHAAAIGLVHRIFRGRHQARGQAIYGSLTFGIGGTAGSLLAGYAWEPLGAALTFTTASVCALAGCLLVVWKVGAAESG